MIRCVTIAAVLFSAVLAVAPVSAAGAEGVPDYEREVAPIFKKYCVGCHEGDEAEGNLDLSSFAGVMRGAGEKPVVVPSQAKASRLLQVLGQDGDPAMPPEDNEAPSAEEIAVLAAWVAGGAPGPVTRPAAMKATETVELSVPEIAVTGDLREPITAVAVSPDGRLLAVAEYGEVEIRAVESGKTLERLRGHAGQVNHVAFAADGARLFVAAGEPGLFGEVRIWRTADWKMIRSLRGHADSLYCVAVNNDATLLATASYDQQIKLWDPDTGEELRTLSGHNDAVFQVAFHPRGRILASASGDSTVKLWDATTGMRLDTLSQPTKEQYTVAFHPSGRYVAAAGVDNRIRLWEITGDGSEGTNPIVESRFAHEQPIIALRFSPNGEVVVSSAEDGTVKVWDTSGLILRTTLAEQPDWGSGLSIAPAGDRLWVGRLDGELVSYALDSTASKSGAGVAPLTGEIVPKPHANETEAVMQELAEVEPNGELAAATHIPSLPATVAGVLNPGAGQTSDVDLYRIEARAGQTWILETDAHRSKSPADTRLEVLHADGAPVLRVLLRAVRDSDITFRPIDSTQSQIRVHYWEEMDLNQFVYMNGEVCKWYRMPRGPDSGMECYVVGGKRRCYFDTSAMIHALNDPIYIVEPYPPGTQLPDNGLPVFPIYYANDDDGDRKLGSDSQLTFTAPADGSYLVRVTDVRGFGGEDYKYRLMIREPQPSFKASVAGRDAKLSAGSGQRITFKLDRIDGFNGEVRFDVAGLPSGYTISTPTVIQAGHVEAEAVLNAAADAPAHDKSLWEQVQVTATAQINGKEVVQPAGNLGTVQVQPRPKVIVHLEPETTTGGAADGQGGLIIAPGTTITARLWIERFDDFQGELKFDVDNLPHGVIVDNIGLSGVLIRQGETERQIFLTASSWVPETSRMIHAVGLGQGNQASTPIRLTVRGKSQLAEAGEPAQAADASAASAPAGDGAGSDAAAVGGKATRAAASGEGAEP